MTKLTLRAVTRNSILGGIALLVAVAGTLSAATVTHGAPLAKPKSSWMLRSGNIFTTPKGMGSSIAYTRDIKNSIRYSPKGSTITASIYSITDWSVANEFIRAHRRGVNVQIITWDGGVGSRPTSRAVSRALKKALGTNARARSYYRICKGSCYTTGKDGSSHHAKLVLFSKVSPPNGQKLYHVTFVTSANFSLAAIRSTWNHTQVIVGRKKIYDTLKSYVDGMRYGKTKRFSGAIKEGPYTLYLFPSSNPVNPVYNLLMRTRCQAAKGYGANGRTVIRVAMYLWTSSERKISKRLAQLAKQGCNIRVVLTGPMARRGVVWDLLRAKIPVWDSYNGKHNRYTHTKLVVISGKVGKQNQNLTIGGNVNFTYEALRQNTEVMVIANNKAQADQAWSYVNKMTENSVRIRSHKSPRIPDRG